MIEIDQRLCKGCAICVEFCPKSVLAMKGAYPEQELEELPEWVNVLSVERLGVPYLHAERHLVIMSVSGSDLAGSNRS